MSIKLKDQNNNEIFIAGTNSEDFINDKVLRNDKTWSSNKIVEELYPTFQKEGNPIICYPVENYPLNVKATFLPKQAGSGDPSPDNVRPILGWDKVQVTRCGKNLLDFHGSLVIPQSSYYVRCNETTNVDLFNAVRRLPRDVLITFSAVFSHFTMSGSYKQIIIFFANDDKVTFNLIDVKSNIIPADYGEILFMTVYAGKSKTQDCNVSNIQFELGSTPSSYEPYQGETSTLTLPETIYGGTVDAVTGVGSKTWGYIASYNGESLPGEWISDRDVYASGTTPTTGAQVAYKLTTPESFQATGNQALPAVAGLNTVYTDGDSLIISGKEDIKYTINQITSNIQNINQIQEINNILLGVE